MKKLITTIVLMFATTLCGWSATISIGISGSFFTNYYAFGYEGDVLEFTLVSPHTATRVSEANWNTNNAVALGGGFNFTTQGVHQYTITAADVAAGAIYYACMMHMQGGMKGQVIIQEPTPVYGKVSFEELNFFPNPTTGLITLENNEPAQVQVYDQYGSIVKDVYIDRKGQVDLSTLNNGIYFVSVMSGDKREKVGRVVKR